jgi:maltose alpha-D-glucosyltransferase/alpha-amylase
VSTDLSRLPGYLYGIDVSRFRDADGDGLGDLRGVIERLEYVAGLGATYVWLLPFYPSGRRDNGYDVDDHRAVDPRLGTIDDVARLVQAAHALGIGVILDLVAHHTSDRHPWFLASREGDPRFSRYYLWRDEPVPVELDPPMFPGEEATAWSADPVRGQWYRHAFYGYEPDLNHEEPEVREELYRIAEFWVDQGVDGFRIDAASHIVDTVGADRGGGGTSLSFFDELRARLDARRPGMLLIGEADVPPAEGTRLLGERRFDALLGFRANSSLVLALARGDARPLAAAILAVPEADRSSWVQFLRNVDELDLERLDPESRAEVLDRFAPRPGERMYGRGIRRGWAPMIARRDRLELSLSLLFALPGLPLVMAGQELAMGDDLSLPGRTAVRLPMQWDASGDGGFSAAGVSPLVRAAQHDGAHGIPRANAAAAERDPDSLIGLLRRLAGMRRADPELRVRTLPDEGPAPVLVLEGARSTTVHNLGSEAVDVPDRLGPHRLGPFTGDRIEPSGYGWFDPRDLSRG